MVYGRDYNNAGAQGEYFGAREPWDTDRYDSRNQDGRPSSAHDYATAGRYGDNERGASQRLHGNSGRDGYGARDLPDGRYRQRTRPDDGRGYQERGDPYRGSYMHDGHRFADEHRGRDHYRAQAERSYGDRSRGQGYEYEDRGFLARAGDEVRSWFGDDEAERRRELDTRYDEKQYGQGAYGRDDDYHQWRKSQIDALDRDYHEYRQENRGRFESEFGTWRTERQGQRGLLGKVTEHWEVVGADGVHIGTVDKVKDDRILLTKNDADAGGWHHSIPSRWIEGVDDKVTVRKTAEEAKAHWRDEENNQALFGDGLRGTGEQGPRIRDRNSASGY